MIEIKKITATDNLNELPTNQPFEIWGRMLVSYDKGIWSYEVEHADKSEEMIFPDFPYDISQPGTCFLAAYQDNQCVGVAVLKEDWFRYLYLDDLKVDKAYRGQGIGARLIEASIQEAVEQGKLGLYTVGQDTNLSACLFYLKQGFEIGGFNNRNYRGTVQESKADIYFYKDIV